MHLTSCLATTLVSIWSIATSVAYRCSTFVATLEATVKSKQRSFSVFHLDEMHSMPDWQLRCPYIDS